MIDVVIPLGTGSEWKNKELVYCLRSIEKFLTGYRNIYVVGEHPGFEGNFIHIPAKDHGFNIQDNIRRKIEIACEHPDISRTFYFTNDDHVLLKPLHAPDLPYYYDGDLELAYRRKRRIGSYKYALNRTNEVLQEKYYANYHFDIHVPILYDKVEFPKVMKMFPWNTEKWGMVIKSLYCNVMMINGIKYPDCQIGYKLQDFGQIEDMIKNRFVFAYNDQGTNQVMFDYLEQRFPQ